MLQTRIMQRATSYARPRSLILWNLKGYPDKWGRGSMPKYIFFPVYQGGEEILSLTSTRKADKKK